VPIALKLAALTLLPLIVLATIPAEDASARGGTRFGKSNASGGHHHHSHRFRHGSRSSRGFGFFIGGATLIPWYYAPAPYYPYPYVEQDGYWYYCPAAQAYYPYVTQCPGAEWQRIEPNAPPG
jgi:hypothetical protein